MIGPASRRTALGAILAAPLATVPALATAAETVSPDLLRLIRRCEAYQAVNARAHEGMGFFPGLAQAAGKARARVVLFASRGWADTAAKAECLARIWPLEECEEETRCSIEGNRGRAFLDDMARGIAAEVMRLADAGKALPCA